MPRRRPAALGAAALLLLAVCCAAAVLAARPAAAPAAAAGPTPPPKEEVPRVASDKQWRRAQRNLRTLLQRIAPATEGGAARGIIPVTARSLKRYVQAAPRLYTTVLFVSTRNPAVDCYACGLLAKELSYAANAYHAQVHAAALALGVATDGSAADDDDDDGSAGAASALAADAQPDMPLRGVNSPVFFVELDVWDERSAFRALGLQSLPHVYVIGPSLPAPAAAAATEAGSTAAAAPAMAYVIPLPGFGAHSNVTAYPLGRLPQPDEYLPLSRTSALRAENVVRFVAKRTGRLRPTRAHAEAPERDPEMERLQALVDAADTKPLVSVSTAGAALHARSKRPLRLLTPKQRALARVRRHAQRRRWRVGDPNTAKQRRQQQQQQQQHEQSSSRVLTGDEGEPPDSEIVRFHRIDPPVTYGGGAVFERTEWGAPSFREENDVWRAERKRVHRRNTITTTALFVCVLAAVLYLAYRVLTAANKYVLLFLVSCVLFFCWSGGWFTMLRGVPFIGMTHDGRPQFLAPSSNSQYGLEGFATGLINAVCAICFAAVVACARPPPRRDLHRPGVMQGLVDDGGISIAVAATFVALFFLFLVLRTLYTWKMPAYLRAQ